MHVTGYEYTWHHLVVGCVVLTASLLRFHFGYHLGCDTDRVEYHTVENFSEGLKLIWRFGEFEAKHQY